MADGFPAGDTHILQDAVLPRVLASFGGLIRADNFCKGVKTLLPIQPAASILSNSYMIHTTQTRSIT